MQYTVTKKQILNITTGILHTPIKDVYIFIEKMLDSEGIMTHQLPRATECLKLFLKQKLPSEFFIKEHQPEKEGEYTLETLTKEEKKIFFEIFGDSKIKTKDIHHYDFLL